MMKKKKVAWGISGAGDKIVETMQAMEKINEEYEDQGGYRGFYIKSWRSSYKIL